MPHPVSGIRLLSKPYFYYLQIIIVSQSWMKNWWHYLNFTVFYITDVSNRKLSNNVGNDFLGSPRPLSRKQGCSSTPPLFLKVGKFLKLHHRSLQ
jgi:hypothetical protein